MMNEREIQKTRILTSPLFALAPSRGVQGKSYYSALSDMSDHFRNLWEANLFTPPQTMKKKKKKSVSPFSRTSTIISYHFFWTQRKNALKNLPRRILLQNPKYPNHFTYKPYAD